MASFVALNVEPEEDTEEEVDDTKEIQVCIVLTLIQIPPSLTEDLDRGGSKALPKCIKIALARPLVFWCCQICL